MSQEQPNIVVVSKIKETLRDAGMRSDADLPEAISAKVHIMLTEAMNRANQNGRTTVRPHDL